MEDSSDDDSDAAKDAAKMKLEDLELSSRTTTALSEAGIRSVAGLTRKTAASLKELDGVGDKAITEITEALSNLGLSLKD